MKLFRLFAPFVGLLALTFGAVAEDARLALVISQTSYEGELSQVLSAESEADQIASALEETGFTVTRAHDKTKAELRSSLNTFRRQVDAAGKDAIAFIYYTGHGAQHPETNDSYLLGIDAELVTASDLAVYGLDLQTQRDGFAATSAKAVFLVFDACRNVPGLQGYKSGTKGLSRVEAAPDMLIAYATGLGDVAKEGIYAPVLAEEILRPGQKAEAAFAAAQRRVAGRTNREQLPWTNNLLYNEFCFSSCEAPSMLERPQPFELVMSGYELDQAFATVYGTDVPATVTTEDDEKLDYEPAFAVKFDEYIALVTKAKNQADAHVASGRISAHYIKDGEIIGEWPELAFGSGFGEPPTYSLRQGLLTYPTLMLQSDYTGQGYTQGLEELIEITPDGPQKRGIIPTLEDTTGAAWEESKVCTLVGEIKPHRMRTDAFLVDYKFTAFLKGEDRVVEYVLDPETGEYKSDNPINPESCVELMYPE